MKWLMRTFHLSVKSDFSIAGWFALTGKTFCKVFNLIETTLSDYKDKNYSMSNYNILNFEK